MADLLPGDAFAGTTTYVPHIGAGEPGGRTVEILRRHLDGQAHSVWAVTLETPKAARALHAWMTTNPNCWSFWGRLALRVGPEAAGRLIMRAAAEHERDRIEREREQRADAREQARLARQIELFYYDPKKKPPSLGLERGNESSPFFRMTFTEKWERDRVLDWLRNRRELFAEMEELWSEHGSLALERHILAGMRETERDVKARGISAGGRRPLRFWRGE